MKARPIRHLVLTFVLAFTGCDQSGTAQKLTSLEEKVATLEKELKSQGDLNGILFKGYSEGLKQSNERLDFLSTRVLEDAFQQKTAVLDPSSKGYAVLDTGRGSLLISCDGAEPYLDGHRLKLRFGNPLYMQFSGFKLKFKFGRKPPAFPTKENTKQEDLVKAFEQWQKDSQTWKTTLKKSEESFTDDLKPGAWTTVEATLPQTKPEDIAYLEVAIDTDRISLQKQ